MSLKDQIAADMAVFFNSVEFGETHKITDRIGSRYLTLIIDNDRLSKRTKKEYEGICVGDVLFFVPTTAYGERPRPDSQIYLDDVPYFVFDAKEDDGMYEIILKASEI